MELWTLEEEELKICLECPRYRRHVIDPDGFYHVYCDASDRYDCPDFIRTCKISDEELKRVEEWKRRHGWR